MPITFKSRHAPNLVMLEKVGLELIHLMGHSGTVPGSLAKQDIAPALARLEAALSTAGSQALEADRDGETEEDADDGEAVSAAHRAAPLLEMLRRALAEDDYVIWDR